MPKKGTGYTPKKSKESPIAKQAVPDKALSLKPLNMPRSVSKGNLTGQSVTSKVTNMPNPLNGGPNNTAALPGARFPKLTRPAKITPRTPHI